MPRPHTLFTAVLAVSALALAAEPPTPVVAAPSADAIKQTWDYFYRGHGQGPILVDLILCGEIGKDGPNKFECTQPLDPGAPLKAGAAIYLWQSYLVPQGDTVEDLMVQVKQGSVVRETKDVKVKGDGWRARQWTGLRLAKPGDWSITLMRGEKILKTLNVKVQ